MKKYLKPKSLTWIVGLGLIIWGVYAKQPETVGVGLGLIGLRGAIQDSK
jgi:hypothetical protein